MNISMKSASFNGSYLWAVAIPEQKNLADFLPKQDV